MTHVFDASLYDEAQSLNKRAGRDDLTTGTLIDSLAFARDAEKRLDEEYKDLVQPFKDSMKPFEADRKALGLVFKGAAEKFESKLLDVFKKNKSLPEETNNGVRLTVALLPRLGMRKDLGWGKAFTGLEANFQNATGPEQRHTGIKIDAKFILPLDQCIDWKAIQQLQKEGEELPAWVEQFDQVSLRTKLPEVTE